MLKTVRGRGSRICIRNRRLCIALRQFGLVLADPLSVGLYDFGVLLDLLFCSRHELL